MNDHLMNLIIIEENRSIDIGDLRRAVLYAWLRHENNLMDREQIMDTFEQIYNGDELSPNYLKELKK